MALKFLHRTKTYSITKTTQTISINGTEYPYEVIAHHPERNTLFLRIDGAPYRITYAYANKQYRITSINAHRTQEIISRPTQTAPTYSLTPATHIRSPLAGRVIKTCVSPNQFVQKNDPLIVIESMKMENEIRAQHDAFIKTISISEGDVVQTNQVLIEFDENKNGGNDEQKPLQNS